MEGDQHSGGVVDLVGTVLVAQDTVVLDTVALDTVVLDTVAPDTVALDTVVPDTDDQEVVCTAGYRIQVHQYLLHPPILPRTVADISRTTFATPDYYHHTGSHRTDWSVD